MSTNHKQITTVILVLTVISITLTIVMGIRGPKKIKHKNLWSKLSCEAPPPQKIETLFNKNLSLLSTKIINSKSTPNRSHVQETIPQPVNNALYNQPIADLPWESVEMPLAPDVKRNVLNEIQTSLQTLSDPNNLELKTSIYQKVCDRYSNSPESLAVANQIAIYLCESGQFSDAVNWCKHILAQADSQSIGGYVRINLALAYLDLGRVSEAQDILNTVLNHNMLEDGNADNHTMNFIATGVLGNIHEIHGEYGPASELYQNAFNRGVALMQKYPDQTWPILYTGMTYVWRLNLLLEKNDEMALGEAMALREDFLKNIPLIRWTWQQHRYFRDAISPYIQTNFTIKSDNATKVLPYKRQQESIINQNKKTKLKQNDSTLNSMCKM